MSFYVGKPNNKSLCHVTNGNHNISTMRGAPFADTVFHSDMNYIQYEEYTLGNGIATTVSVWEKCGNLHYYGATKKIPYAAYAKMKAGYAYMILDSGGNFSFSGFTGGGTYAEDYCSVGSGCWEVSPCWQTKTSSSLGLLPVYAPSQNKKLTWSVMGTKITQYLYYEGKNNPTTIIIFNFKYDGTFIPYPRPGNDVYINRSNFKVNGVNILNFKYVNFNVINNSDAVAKITYPQAGYCAIPNGYFCDKYVVTDAAYTINMQLINSRAKGAGVEIVSKPGVSYIARGGKKIISSEFGAQHLYIMGFQRNGTAGFAASGTGERRLGPYTTALPLGGIAMVHFNAGTGEIFTVILKATGGTRTIAVHSHANPSAGSLYVYIEMNANRRIYFIVKYSADYVNVPAITCSTIMLS